MSYLERLPNTIALLLAIAVILVLGYKAIIYYAEHQPIYEPESEENQQRIAADHVDKVQRKRTADSMDELLAKHGVSAEDRAALLAGTKLP